MILEALKVLRPPPKLTLIEWADRFRYVAAKTSASPGRWKTIAQPCAFGPMAAILKQDTHTVSIMAATQVVKTEFCINVAGYFIAQDPAAMLFVQPTQGAAEAFSKERFAPTVEVTTQLRELVDPPRSRNSENTITHKSFPGGALDFVGANSPTDLASRPIRIVIADEIDKYPASAGSEGDPLKLAEERASTYKALGRAKFVRTCSPTLGAVADDQPPISRIGREYLASDQRKLFVPCGHCGHEQVLTWKHVRWDRDEANNHLPQTAAIECESCGVLWTERERLRSLEELAKVPGYGWRQTAKFVCCGDVQFPKHWDDEGRSLCAKCGTRSLFSGHAGFHVSKLASARHHLAEVVQEFMDAKSDHELLRKWTNTALAELWRPQWAETFDSARLITRAEPYSGEDLPEDVRVITGFCDTQANRLEVQLVAWGADEECWPFQYTIIHQNPSLPQAWKELDALMRGTFKTVSGRVLRIAAFGIDMGGHHGAQVLAFCRQRRGRRVFACKGMFGARPIWPGRASRSKSNDPIYILGVDTAKDQICSALRIDPPEPGQRKPAFIHFPVAENFSPEYFEQLNSERRQVTKKMGQPVTRWVQIRDRNEALDTLVGCLAMRKSLPRVIEQSLQFKVTDEVPGDVAAPLLPTPSAEMIDEEQQVTEGNDAVRHSAFENKRPFVPTRRGWMNRE